MRLPPSMPPRLSQGTQSRANRPKCVSNGVDTRACSPRSGNMFHAFQFGLNGVKFAFGGRGVSGDAHGGGPHAAAAAGANDCDVQRGVQAVGGGRVGHGEAWWLDRSTWEPNVTFRVRKEGPSWMHGPIRTIVNYTATMKLYCSWSLSHPLSDRRSSWVMSNFPLYLG